MLLSVSSCNILFVDFLVILLSLYNLEITYTYIFYPHKSSFNVVILLLLFKLTRLHAFCASKEFCLISATNPIC